jgi:hypothetical protein
MAGHTGRARLLCGLFCALSAASLFIHPQSATNWECMRWNVAPSQIRDAPWRIWDWHDPQFLRGLAPKTHEHHGHNAALSAPGADGEPNPLAPSCQRRKAIMSVCWSTN